MKSNPLLIKKKHHEAIVFSYKKRICLWLWSGSDEQRKWILTSKWKGSGSLILVYERERNPDHDYDTVKIIGNIRIRNTDILDLPEFWQRKTGFGHLNDWNPYPDVDRHLQFLTEREPRLQPRLGSGSGHLNDGTVSGFWKICGSAILIYDIYNFWQKGNRVYNQD